MHIGKYWPSCNRPDRTDIWPGGDKPPRKWRYKATHSGTLGTLAVPWQDLEIVSEIWTVSNDGQYLEWQVNHPTVDDNYQLIRWTFGPEVGQHSALEILLKFEFWYHGVMYGDNEIRKRSTSGIFTGAQWLCTTSISWQHLVNPSMFQQINRSEYYAARWQDDPDYQPYNNNPYHV